MSLKAKICGVRTPEAVAAALDGGAAYIGFTFFPASPRKIDPMAATRLAAPARGRGAKVVALTVDPTDADLEALTRDFQPDLLQLHGKETPARVREIAARTGLGIIKAMPVSEAADIAAARAYEPMVEHLMFDARPPKDADRPGGLGAPFDWTLLAGQRFSRPWFLAGGLDPWNVAEAAKLSGAPMVDVSDRKSVV